ncbi:MAG TPA: hypothetical protein VJV96_20960 [Candidatus Angelobacter sp.]|nr:hypothetical protein [Candidatus Angelobacter sp.]HKT52783.1 hypothetical protein [Candidatus Angelobacter sp.]
MQQNLRADIDNVQTMEILARILDGCIAFDPYSRVLLSTTDFTTTDLRIVVGPERRRRRFNIPSLQS